MIEYTVRIPSPASHHVDVSLRLGAAPDGMVVWMPTWTPGSYLIREFARNIRELVAHGADGTVFRVEREDKNSFRVHATPGAPVEVDYRLYAFEQSVRTSYVVEDNALLNSHSVFLGVRGMDEVQHRVVLELPAGWEVATALARDGDGHRFTAPSYHDLNDAPIQCGRFDRVTFSAAGRPHEVVVVGGGNHDLEGIAGDTTRLVEAAARMLGGLPYERYVFLVQNGGSGRGGLEHRDSSVLQFPRFAYADKKTYHDFLTLVAHEHFHAWNVKRTKPRDFTPYDFDAETYTRLLWVCEGVTAYYDELLPVRAGVVTREAYLRRLGEEITRYRRTPGRRRQSLAEASMLAWIQLYRPDEDSRNAGVSYYQKGSLVALLLDVEIRRASHDARSLDDVLRELFARYPERSPGFTEEEFESLASEVSGVPLAAFFARHVRGTDELDFEGALAHYGLVLERHEASRPSTYDLLGARIPKGGARLVIESVDADGPAAAAGLSARDEIIAVGGYRVGEGALAARLAGIGPGRTAAITIFRDDRLATMEVTLSPSPSRPWRIRESEPSARREAWFRG